MKIIVCMKEVPDTASTIKIDDSGRSIQREAIQYVINPYDEFAIEEALRIKDRLEEVEVVLICMGPQRAQESIRKALAMGGDRAIHCLVDQGDWIEGLTVARVLHQKLVDEKPDLILMGKQAVDDDAAQVAPMLAGLFQFAQAMNVIQLELNQEECTATREVEKGRREILKLKLPAVIGVTKGINEPRYPALKGIMAAKKKEIRSEEVSELIAADEGELTLERLSLPAQRQVCQMIEGEAVVQARSLVQKLRQEAKVI